MIYLSRRRLIYQFLLLLLAFRLVPLGARRPYYIRFSISILTIIVAICVMIVVFTHRVNAQPIVINEFDIHAGPQVAEFFNLSESRVDMSGWYVDDSSGSTYVAVPSGTVIEPYSCVVVQGNFNLNVTSTDTIRLFDNTAPPTNPSSILLDSYSYNQFGTVDQSYTRIPNGIGNFKLTTRSIGLHNDSYMSCAIPQSSPTPTPLPTPTSLLPQSPTHTPLPSLNHTPTPSHKLTLTLTPSPSPTVSNTPAYHVYISEAMVNPIMGNEWIELYNKSEIDVTLSQWYLDDLLEGGSVPYTFTASLPARGYTVIELPSFLYNNGGDSVRLLNEKAEEVEIFLYSFSEPNISWGRSNFTNEEADVFCLQTPSKGSENYPCFPTITPTLIKTPIPTSPPIPTYAPQPEHLYLSELYPNPLENEHEWIEIYNDNKFTISLQNWYIKDASGQVLFTVTREVPPYGFVVYELSSSKLNNVHEKVELFNGLDILVDSTSYEESEQGLSWGRSSDSFGTWCLQNISRSTYNKTCKPLATGTPTETPTPTKTPTPTRTHTPIPTTRISINSPNQTTQSHPGNVLGISSNVHESQNIHINYTPQLITSPAMQDYVALGRNEANEETDDEDMVSINPYWELIFYTTLTFASLIVIGFQTAYIWNAYKKTYA